jgi:hypothetical protein
MTTIENHMLSPRDHEILKPESPPRERADAGDAMAEQSELKELETDRMIAHHTSPEFLSAFISGIKRVAKELETDRMIAHHTSPEFLSAFISGIKRVAPAGIVVSWADVVVSIAGDGSRCLLFSVWGRHEKSGATISVIRKNSPVTVATIFQGEAEELALLQTIKAERLAQKSPARVG